MTGPRFVKDDDLNWILTILMYSAILVAVAIAIK